MFATHPAGFFQFGSKGLPGSMEPNRHVIGCRLEVLGHRLDGFALQIDP